VCHDQTNTYQKGLAGLPKEEVDLVAVARSVAGPTRNNCGQCHFKGGGGDAVKHGDMDGSMYFPSERIDVHMGRLDFNCTTCHQTRKHQIPGCAMSVCVDRRQRVGCTDCHTQQPHAHERLDAHTDAVACQTCHIPRMAIDAATKMVWDWSEAGQDGRAEDPHEYLKGKGSFKYAQNTRPEYYWYNGRAYRYLTGDKIDPDRVVRINFPLGSPADPTAKIWPFKVHRGRQIYDKKFNHLLTPRTWGEGGYWTEFDWDLACRRGAESTGLEYSGQYGFVDTEMYWPLSHMVQTKDKALQCIDCHGSLGIMDWRALGYEGDPAFRGDRRRMELLRGGRGESR
jgi:octaheme c-type cytochrome (tetrathionate reductase family)